MPARWLAFVIALALLPTAELVEQAVHVVEHTVAGEAAGHDAHHDEDAPAEEHGCTELVHVCGSHHGFGVAPPGVAPVRVMHEIAVAEPIAANDLHDLTPREPPYRPPIG